MKSKRDVVGKWLEDLGYVRGNGDWRDHPRNRSRSFTKRAESHVLQVGDE